MASYQFLCLLVFTSLLLLFISASHSSSGNNAAIEATASVISSKSSPQKVDLALYYESLCPYCKDFIVDPLANAVETDLMTIVNLKLVPWGNAVVQNQTIQCQHGEDECYLNTIHACTINRWPDVKTHFNFIKCIEKQTTLKNGVDTTWKSCADQLGLPQDAIKQCYDSGHGKKLLLQYGNITDGLHPPHEYVPWVVWIHCLYLMILRNLWITSVKHTKANHYPRLAVHITPTQLRRKGRSNQSAMQVKQAQPRILGYAEGSWNLMLDPCSSASFPSFTKTQLVVSILQ